MRIAWLKHRAWLVWTFVKMLDKAKHLEDRIKEAEQQSFDLQFASHLRDFNEGKELCFRVGYIEGIKWCLKVASRG